MGKICVFFAEGFEEIEALTVVDILRRAGIETAMVSITDERTVTGSHQIAVGMDFLYEEIEFSEVDMIVLPGGMPGTKNLEAYAPLLERIAEFDTQGKKIAAICAAPSILGHMGILRGRNACSFPDYESHLEGAEVTQDEVEVSEHIITSRGMGCAVAFSLAIVESFQGSEAAREMGNKIIYRK